jgi:deoxycytidine triphosphate deaminase
MYLSDRDIRWAVDKGLLIIDPLANGLDGVDPTSVDLHLDRVEEAKVWDLPRFSQDQGLQGTREPELRLGSFMYKQFAGKYLTAPPEEDPGDQVTRVFRRGRQVLIRPGGFLLWQTKERVGTPKDNPQFICFVDGKSTRARTGIVVHLTAPTIHAGWAGRIVLEIANLGPFTFVLQEDDVIAQITIATVSSVPQKTHQESGTSTLEQRSVEGSPHG